jgi:hemerythrin-like metal-binding protein
MSIMAQMQWHSWLETGVEHLDAQHRRLVELANRLDAALSGGDPNGEIGRVLADLVVYSHEHFAAEEELMQQIGFYGLHQHRTEHRRIAQQIKGFLLRLKQGGKVSPTELLTLLRNWINTHIAREDTKIGKAAATRRSVTV